ncbi:hypothetical protein Tco_0214432 [Tanacetum coccineum]
MNKQNAEIGESSLTGPELVLDMTDKVVLIKEKLKAARDRQKSYADNRRKPLEFEVGDQVMLKVSPWKGVIRFGKKGKLAPRYVGPFEILERVSPVAYRLRLPEELSRIKVDKILCFIEEPVENSDHEVKRLKCSRMVVVKAKLQAIRYLVKVSWNSKCNFELTWIRIGTVLKFDFLRSTCASKWLLGIMRFGAGVTFLPSVMRCDFAYFVGKILGVERRGELNGAKIAKWLEETLTLGLLIPLSRGSFDVIMGMDWLSKRKFGIVCHEKVVRIPLEGDEILRVHGERTQGVVKTLMNTKVEFHIDLVHGATSVAKSPYRLTPLEMQELSENFEIELEFTEEEKLVKLKQERSTVMTIQSSVRDKILATSSETSKVENAPAEMMRDLDQQMEKRADDGCTLWIKLYSKYEYEIRYHPGKANVVIEALSRKERVKPRRVRAMAMYLFKYGARGMILTAKVKALKQANVTRRTYLTV